MARPLPRTDSREFEVMQSQAPASPLERAGAPRNEYELFINFWGKDNRAGVLRDPSWNAQNALARMTADVVIASNGKLANELVGAMVARFQTLENAATTAKRIHRCVSAFANLHPEGSWAVGIALGGGMNAGTTTSYPGKNLIILPARIVLEEGIWERLQAIPGMQLRKLAAEDTSGTAIEIGELLWTPTRNAPEVPDFGHQPLRVTVRKRPASAAPPGADAIGFQANKRTDSAVLKKSVFYRPLKNLGGALSSRLSPTTMGWIGTASVVLIVFSVLLFRHQPPVPPVGRRSLEKAAKSEIPGNSTASDSTRSSQPKPVSTPVQPLENGAKSQIPRSAEPTKGSGQSNILWLNNSPPSNPAASTAPNGAASIAPKPKATDRHTDLPPTTSEEPSSTQATGAAPSAAVAGGAQANASPPPQPDQGNGAVQPQKPGGQDADVREVQGYRKRDIQLLLDMADADRGAGDYEKAAYEYRVVQQLDKGNVRAKQGLRQIQMSQKPE
ncbi:MAG: hypothetical protein JO159_11710 [Acidobacteria bacterium]|nr:hypothetical protein [Acidobacteriota bacterium]MBV9625654.1 hypothetical protein [Acidobacteriota bacterium]